MPFLSFRVDWGFVMNGGDVIRNGPGWYYDDTGSPCPLFHIPMFDKVLQIELTILTSLG